MFSEVFVIVSLTLFLPICLEQFARDNGFLLPDKTLPCSSLKPTPETGRATAVDAVEAARCVVKIGWAWIDTASFRYVRHRVFCTQTLTSILACTCIRCQSHCKLSQLYRWAESLIIVRRLACTLVQYLFTQTSTAPHRKVLLLGFAALGSIAATLFLLLSSSSPIWYLSVVLAICANVGFGASTVAMNAYIPSLALEAQDVVMFRTQLEDLDEHSPESSEDDPDMSTENPEAPLLPSSPTAESDRKSELEAEYHAEVSRETSRISSMGIALGYGAGICLLLVALVPVTRLHGSTFALRLAIGLSGIWWAIFSIPAALWLPSASSSSSSLPSHRRNGRAEEVEVEDKNWSVRKEISAAWVRLGTMLRWSEIKKLRNTFKYLAAWFLLSDGGSLFYSPRALTETGSG